MGKLLERLEALSPEKRQLLEVFLRREGLASASEQEEHVAPRSPSEQRLAEIWGRVLGLEQVSVRRSFFSLGGDSINSIQVVAKAHQAGLPLTTTLLFENPTIEKLASLLAASSATATDPPFNACEPAPAGLPTGGERLQAAALLASVGPPGSQPGEDLEDLLDLSSVQLGMLLDSLRRPAAGVYVEQTLALLEGELDLARFARAWQTVIDRHPALRSGFRWQGLERPLSLVYRSARLAIRSIDTSALASRDRERLRVPLSSAERRRPFDLERPPLMRLLVVRETRERHQIVWTSCHLVLDAWCLGILLPEVFTIYRELRSGVPAALEPVVPYRRFIDWLLAQDWKPVLAAWSERLRDYQPPPLIPGDPGAVTDGAFSHETRELPPSLSLRLESFCRAHGLTLNVLVAAAWALELGRLLGRRDVIFGQVLAGRSAGVPGAQSIVGLMINTLPLRVQWQPDQAVLPWLEGILLDHRLLLAAEHAPLSLVQAAAELPPGRQLFESLLVFLNAVKTEPDLGGLRLVEVSATGRSSYPLVLRATPGRCLKLEILFDPGRFGAGEVRQLQSRLEETLDRLSGAESETLSALERGSLEVIKMSNERSTGLDLASLRSIKPRTLESGGEDLVRLQPLLADGPLPLLVEPAGEDVDLPAWLAANASRIDAELTARGGVLLRGFALRSLAAFESCVSALEPERLEYRERSTPRTELGNRIYTSTEYPADQEIALHNEFSYALSWPRTIFFHCTKPAAAGGETPIADSRQILKRLDPQVRRRFQEKGVMYVRNFGLGIDLSWQEAFQTSDRGEVEAYCRDQGLSFEWRGGDRLQTRQVRRATAVHPLTGEEVWFNQAHLFHPTNLVPEVRQGMLAILSEHDLPRNALYGDGSPIADADLEAVREAIRSSTISFPWQRGDILILDNMLVAHGRRAFAGERQVVVAMARRYSPPETEKAV